MTQPTGQTEPHEPLPPQVLEDDQTSPPRPEEDLADVERSDPAPSDPSPGPAAG